MGVNTIASNDMKRYFEALESELARCYKIAEEARKQGCDPELFPEIPAAEDLAARVEKLVGPEGIADRIRTLAEKNSREEVAIKIAVEIMKKEMRGTTAMDLGKIEKAIDQAIRTALAVLTEGVLVAPLEGIAGVKIKKNTNGTSYLSIYYAGPIRASGGTAQALSVLISDIIRREAGLSAYLSTSDEVERYKEEVPLYKQVQHLQYSPTPEEIESIVRNCPVCVDGEGTEEVEVSGKRNLPRVETNRVRGGACLVIAEGLCLKAPKIQKHVKKLKIDGWEFIDNFVTKAVADKSDSASSGAQSGDNGASALSNGSNGPNNSAAASARNKKTEIPPNWKYMKELIAGRPVFSHPSRKGGFRLRYGRARCAGLAAISLNPATMFLLDEFIAVGTQMKIERPGKAGAITPCDTIEGPIVLLKNGDLLQVNDIQTALSVRSSVEKIVDAGEILIPYGEFSENNHLLMPGAYATEWWQQEYERALKNSGENDVAVSTLDEKTLGAEQAFRLSEKYGIPLHPKFNLFWHDVSCEDIAALSQFLKEHARFETGRLIMPRDKTIKNILIELGCLHEERGGALIITRYAYPLLRCCDFDIQNESIVETERRAALSNSSLTSVQLVSSLAGITLMERSPTRIGGRMGRPEKAEARKMAPPPHVLFPLGEAGGKQRFVNDAAEGRWASQTASTVWARNENGNKRASGARLRAQSNGVQNSSSPESGDVTVEVCTRVCPACGKESFLYRCECGAHTLPQFVCPRCGRKISERCPACDVDAVGYKEQTINVKDLLVAAQAHLGEARLPESIKGVVGLVSKNKSPEPLEKGILRAKNDVYVFKDGTIRFDMTDLPLTHFKPKEIGTSVERLRALGYTHDYRGTPLENENQVIELKIQDVIVPKTCGDYLVKAATYVDDLLVKLYRLKPYYSVERREDLIGHLVIGLAPHTSAGILARLIGYTDAKAQYAHPFFQAGKRRNCDGDEDAVMLVMDALINFSRSYLPSSRGGLMDAPLVLGTRIDPDEIDKEAQNIDVVGRYPLEFYHAATAYKHPSEIKSVIDCVSNRIGTEAQYEGFQFTHDTDDISSGPKTSAYKTLGTMIDKMDAELQLAEKLRAVDKADVARRVIESHFLPDLLGNLKAFSTQSVRCPKCNAKYRRVPLKGVCLKCGGALTLTVHHGSIIKYLEVSKKISEQYNVSPYTRQRIDLVEQSVNSIFQSDKVKKCTIDDFF